MRTEWRRIVSSTGNDLGMGRPVQPDIGRKNGDENGTGIGVCCQPAEIQSQPEVSAERRRICKATAVWQQQNCLVRTSLCAKALFPTTTMMTTMMVRRRRIGLLPHDPVHHRPLTRRAAAPLLGWRTVYLSEMATGQMKAWPAANSVEVIPENLETRSPCSGIPL